MLTKDLAHTIVDKLISVLGKNINIMDRDGNILASGDPARVGTYHEGAAYVIRTKNLLQVKPNDVDIMKGVRPGINLPIVIDNAIVGVVGITGNPAEVISYGELVRYTVEMMLEQAALKEKVHLQERARDIYFQDLLSGNWGDENMFIMRGSLIGIDLLVPRQTMVLEFSSLIEQNVMSEAMAKLTVLLHSQDIVVGAVGTARNIFLLPVDLKLTGLQRRNYLEKVASQIHHLVRQHNQTECKVGVGTYSAGMHGLIVSYRESLDAILLGHCFHPLKPILFYEDLQLEMILTDLPLEKRRSYYETVLGQMIQSAPDRDYYLKQLIETLEIYFEQGLSIKRASDKLYLHRNTLIHRLKKIHSMTGLNPSDFPQAFKLKLALLFYLADQEMD